MKVFALLPGAAWLASAVSARTISPRGTTLWDGRFNDMTSATDLDKWSFSNPVGSYQYYIHGPSESSAYVNLSPDFKNPADSSSKQGVKITLDKTAFWNGQNMRRTELIPQTKAAINKGRVYYHFSVKRSDVNAPSTAKEHQIAFFESHFTELKAGWLSGSQNESDPNLRWMVDGKTQWNVEWEADVWHNVAYEIDFDAGTVGFWHSTGGDALTQVVKPVTASTSSNGADWHLGVLELPRDGHADETEDIYFSGVYIESGTITTQIGSGGSSGDAEPAPKPSSAAPSSSKAPSSAAPAPSSAAPAVSSSAAAAPPAATSAPAAEPTTVDTSAPVAVPTSTSSVVSPETTPAAVSSAPVTTAVPSASSSASPAAPTTTAGAGTRPCKRSKKRAAMRRKARAAGRK